MPWENWNDIYNEVIDPLAQEGADVHCEVIIIAQGDAGDPREHRRTGHQGVAEPAGDQGGNSDGVTRR